MDKYHTLNNLLSGLSISEPNLQLNSNVDSHSKHQTSTQKLKNDLEKDKEKINNTMCFRDLDFKCHKMNDISELLNSVKDREKKETFRDINSELQNRNNLFASSKQLPIFENIPKLTRLGDSK